MGSLHVLEHPLIQHKLALLRNKETGVKEFRELVGEIAQLMCYEATRNLPTQEVEIETPIGKATVRELSGKKLAIVPILRAGLGMVDAMIDLIPSAKVGHIGLYRDPETHLPVEYYCKMPPDISDRQVFVVDPMLATGGSASAAISILKEKYGCKHIVLMDIIAAPEGVAVIRRDHPDIDLFVAAVDGREVRFFKNVVKGLHLCQRFDFDIGDVVVVREFQHTAVKRHRHRRHAGKDCRNVAVNA